MLCHTPLKIWNSIKPRFEKLKEMECTFIYNHIGKYQTIMKNKDNKTFFFFWSGR